MMVLHVFQAAEYIVHYDLGNRREQRIELLSIGGHLAQHGIAKINV